MNLYNYLNGDPLNATDPSGMATKGKILKPISKFAKKSQKQVSKKQRDINNARRRAVSQAWREEKQLVKLTGSGTREWTGAEIKQLLKKGKVKGYAGHHRNTVNGNSLEMAANSDNIGFLSTANHCCVHKNAGGTKVPITGQPLLNRTNNGLLPKLPGRGPNKVIQTLNNAGYVMAGGFWFGVEIGVDIVDSIPDPISFYLDNTVFVEPPD